MSRIVHFEVMAENPQRAVDFYTKVFDWQVNKWDGPEDYWLVTTGADDQPGINGAIGKSQGEPLTVNVVEVPSVDEFAAKVTDHGGKSSFPKWRSPGSVTSSIARIPKALSLACTRPIRR